MTRPAGFARYGFADDGARAADLLGAGRAAACGTPTTQEPVDAGAGDLLAALSRAADPDLALRQLHRMVETGAGPRVPRTGRPAPSRTGHGDPTPAGPTA